MKLSVEQRREPHILSNEEKEKWIEDYVGGETTVARKRVQDTQTPIMQELNGMTTAESAWATPRSPETTFDEMLNAIIESLSDHATSAKKISVRAE